MEQIHRTLRMEYSMTAETKFTVTCDPPYEGTDGGLPDQECVCTRDEVRETVTDLIVSNLARLAADQAPMLIEVRRTS